MYSEVGKMEERVILNEDIEAFGRYLMTEEKSENTVEKYLRDAVCS